MNKFRNFSAIIILAILVLYATCCKGDTTWDGKPTGKGPSMSGFSAADYGYAVYDIEGKNLVMDHNIYSAFIPASVTKLLTAIMAEETLGNDFTFTTGIYYTGDVKNGCITGDIYIKGSGDPELTVHELSLLAEKIRLKGITSVQGNFYYDESEIQPRDMIDPNMPDYAPYNSGIGALNLNRNTLQVIRRDELNSDKFRYELLPSVNSITCEITGNMKTFPFICYTYANGKETWKLPPKKVIAPRNQLPVKHTGNYTASVFSILCGVHGIKLKDPVPSVIPGGSKKICSHESRKLDMIIPSMLISSDNLTAEILGRVVLKKISGDEGRSMTFSEAADLFFSRKLTSARRDGLVITSPSGLSTGNRLTPEQVLSMLILLSGQHRLEDIMPMSGESGTLKSRLDSSSTAFRVYAKTGSLNYSSALAGMFYGLSGKKYLFALFIDNKMERSFLDSRKNLDIKDLEAADKWSKKAANAADSFINAAIQSL